MNRKQAKTEAENNTRTWGDLLAMVESSDLTGRSRVNKNLTKAQVANIFKNMIAEEDVNEAPEGIRYDAIKNRYVMSRDGLAIQNILREFA